ncbi:hypothetical protein QBC38DRAFT_469199 [Podospora fimiseda]|uniref:Uncharacterized protein n=1 Tax=Podospora fimiseda TaxID=252190 RepID=A0AAN7BX80_9PEZI|nr:hypothetical protein QBC38DRAFT_469199 [Podospora fimiseda]
MVNSRVGRVIVIAVLLTIVVFWLGYQTPSLETPKDVFDTPKVGLPTHHDGPKAEDKPGHHTDVDPDTDKTSTDEGADGESDQLGGFQNEFATKTDDSSKPTSTAKCEPYSMDGLQSKKAGPLSKGRRRFPYIRPPPGCRTFELPALEKLIEHMKTVIKDPDLFRLFENSYPNTLDTMVKWRGFANKTDPETKEETVTDEELTYVITGDIDAMWLRDSASQIYSYLPLLEPSEDPNSLASLWRGLINSHSRYIIISPYCHSFQPPRESGIKPTRNDANSVNRPIPSFDPDLVFDCKWELDSLASFLQISAAYYTRTNDLAFFGKYSWINAVEAAVEASAAMRLGTYDEEGHVLPSAYSFTGYTNRGSETLYNDGLGNPTKSNGMVRTAFRPSDDACIFQLLTPANMMFAAYLEQASVIMEGLSKETGADKRAANLTIEMRKLAEGIRKGIAKDAVVKHREFGEIFAYEVDGYGGANLMDDANVPSLLALPLWNYTHSDKTSSPIRMFKSVKNGSRNNNTVVTKGESEEIEHDYAKIYQNTRKFVLSMANPYYAKGPVLSAVGGPHLGPGKGWPMAATVAALTAFESLSGFSTKEREEVVAEQVSMILNSTAGTGVVHETVNAWNEQIWTRSWFGWANGLFGELILKLAEDEEKREVGDKGLLGRIWQD